MPTFFAYAGHYAHHDGAGWLADVVVRSILYSTIGRLMRSLTLAEAIAVAVIAIVLFLAWRRA